MLAAAEGQLDRRDVVVIDPAGAGLQPRDHAMGAGEIVREDPGGEAEFGSIGAGDHLILVIEFQHGHHGAEDLLAHDGESS